MNETRMVYFEQDDILHIVISDEPEAGSVELAPNITVELNAKGELIGIEILTAADCIRGKRFTTVPKCAMDGEQGGATYIDEDVVVDGLLVTGRGYGQNTEVLKQFLRMLKEAP